jgi:hypothetical protein
MTAAEFHASKLSDAVLALHAWLELVSCCQQADDYVNAVTVMQYMGQRMGADLDGAIKACGGAPLGMFTDGASQKVAP